MGSSKAKKKAKKEAAIAAAEAARQAAIEKNRADIAAIKEKRAALREERAKEAVGGEGGGVAPPTESILANAPQENAPTTNTQGGNINYLNTPEEKQGPVLGGQTATPI